MSVYKFDNIIFSCRKRIYTRASDIRSQLEEQALVSQRTSLNQSRCQFSLIFPSFPPDIAKIKKSGAVTRMRIK